MRCKRKEYKVNETFRYRGEKYQCVDRGSDLICSDCDLEPLGNKCRASDCLPDSRKDGRHVIFKEVKK